MFRDLEKMHVRAAKIIFGLDFSTPTKDVISQYNWITLKSVYLKRLAKLVHKCYYGTSPAQLQELFLKRSNTYNPKRRKCLTLPKPSTEMMKKINFV